jgi:uncharacterized phage protein gp47/JayE
MPFPRPNLTTLRTQAMQDIVASDLPNADGFLRRAALRVLAWVQAGLAYLHYGYLDWIALNAVPFTAGQEFLEAWAALAPTPVIRESPTYAAGSAQWPAVTSTPAVVLPSGTILASNANIQYITTADATAAGGVVTASIIALVAGSASNTDAGTPLTLSTVIAGITSTGSASTAVTGGTDLEIDAALRSRMLESYAAPPHGGAQADYVTWALAVPGVTRAWCNPQGMGPGTVVVYFMEDVAEATYGGFPQGANGVATAETRGIAATGDQLAVANYIYAKRNVTALVYGVAPTAQPQNFTLTGLSGISTSQQTQVANALSAMFVQLCNPLGATSIQQSDVAAAIAAISGLPDFTITSPSSWPLTATTGYLITLGAVTYS